MKELENNKNKGDSDNQYLGSLVVDQLNTIKADVAQNTKVIDATLNHIVKNAQFINETNS